MDISERAARVGLVIATPADSPPHHTAIASGPVAAWADVVAAGIRINPDEALTGYARDGWRVMIPGDEEWPATLADAGPAAPLALWVRGDAHLAQASAKAVALVGRSAPTGYGIQIARDLGQAVLVTDATDIGEALADLEEGR